MPHEKGHILPHNKNQETQDKYNYFADRAADMILQYYPDYKNPKYGAEDIGYHKLSPVMTGPTFQARHPELAKDLDKYTTHYGRLVPYLKDRKSMLETIPAQPIPIDDIAMELKGGRIPQHTKKPQPKPQPDIEYVSGYDRIVATINPYNLDDSKYGGNKYTDVSFFELNSTTGKKTFIGNWEDDFETHPSQPVVNFRTSTGEPIQGSIEEVMDSLYRANPQNITKLSEDDRSHPSTYQSSSTGRSPSAIRGEAVDKKTGMPKKYKKGGYVNKYGYGGEVKKYVTGGEVEDIYNVTIDPYQSGIGQGELITSTMNYDTASSMGQTIDLGGYTSAGAETATQATTQVAGDVALTGMEKAGMIGSYAKAIYDVGTGIKEGVEGTKAFYEDADDSMYYDEEAAEKQFKEARAQKVGAGAEAVGFTAGTIVGTALTGNPATGAMIGKVTGDVFEFVGENVSKLFGTGKKAKEHMKKQRGQHIDYVHNERVDAIAIKEQKEQEKKLSEYLMQISNPGQKMYAELGGMLYGPSHAEGGIPIEAEGGEFIIRKDAIKNNKVRTYTGTNKQIAEQINKNIYG